MIEKKDMIYSLIKAQLSQQKVLVMQKQLKIQKLLEVLSQDVYHELSQKYQKYELNSIFRMAHFLGQCAHESCRFQIRYENMNYKTIKRLRQVFGKYFNDMSDQEAQKYLNNPQKLANRTYSNRMDNGSEESGDGYKFRGRGFLQLTGRFNYKKFSQRIDCPQILDNPDLVAQKYPLQAGLDFWKHNKLNLIAEKGMEKQVIEEVAKKVNGGLNGFEERIKFTNEFYKILIE